MCVYIYIHTICMYVCIYIYIYIYIIHTRIMCVCILCACIYIYIYITMLHEVLFHSMLAHACNLRSCTHTNVRVPAGKRRISVFVNVFCWLCVRLVYCLFVLFIYIYIYIYIYVCCSIVNVKTIHACVRVRVHAGLCARTRCYTDTCTGPAWTHACKTPSPDE